MIKSFLVILKRQKISDNIGKSVADLPERFGNEVVFSLSSEYDISKKDLKSLKSLQKTPLFTKKLSEVKYLKEKLKNVKGAIKRKIIIITEPIDDSNSSGEGEMIVQLKKNFHVRGRK
jgi:hypothetical protein